MGAWQCDLSYIQAHIQTRLQSSATSSAHLQREVVGIGVVDCLLNGLHTHLQQHQQQVRISMTPHSTGFDSQWHASELCHPTAALHLMHVICDID